MLSNVRTCFLCWQGLLLSSSTIVWSGKPEATCTRSSESDREAPFPGTFRERGLNVMMTRAYRHPMFWLLRDNIDQNSAARIHIRGPRRPQLWVGPAWKVLKLGKNAMASRAQAYLAVLPEMI